ncbi:potassium/proton antiporter [Nocardioides houyundeii]|uniref:potassium/proton antiporter n=1 Tax=Nocardioides houyundeii TaxID=2045452 RepID=UPI000C78F857|nr:potassium/proton antiporter [Nocardioides houyundeii]
MDLDLGILTASLVLLTGVAAVRVSARAGLPSLLLYLAIGLALGEAGLGIQFEDVDLTMVLSTLALAVILAEGGFSTRWDVIRPVVGLSGLLATLGVALSVTVTAGIAYLALDVEPRTALLLGAVVGSTDAAATFSIMRRLPVLPRIRATLEAESGFNDPPVIILVTVVASDAWHTASGLQIAGLIGYQLVVGVLVGLAVAKLGQVLLAHSALPAAGLYPLATFAIMFLAFAVAGLAGASGLMAIYVAGMWLGNAKLPHRQATAGFADGLGWLAQIGLFVLLGLLASPGRLLDAVVPAAIVGIGLTFVARPLSVMACAVWWRVPWRHQVFISWAGLRGAVPIVLATIPITEGLPSATMIFDVVFLLVTAFVLIQAPLLPWLARRTSVVVERGRDVEVESAPLEDLDASLVQFVVPSRSRLAGVFADDLRLPARAVLALVSRGGSIAVPDRHTSLRPGDHLLLVVPEDVRAATEHRLQAISEHGRLAVWYAGPAQVGPASRRDAGLRPGTGPGGEWSDDRPAARRVRAPARADDPAQP